MIDNENVKTKKDLEDFIILLKDDFKNNFEEWENGTCPNFLEAATACLYAHCDRNPDLNHLYDKLNYQEVSYAAALLLAASFKTTPEFMTERFSADPAPDVSVPKGVYFSEYLNRKLEELQDAGFEMEESIVVFLDHLVSELHKVTYCSSFPMSVKSHVWYFLAEVLLLGKFYE